MHSVTHRDKFVFFFPHAMQYTDCSTWLRFFDEQLLLPNPTHPLRIYVLYKRGSCKMLNGWIDHHERSERCTLLTSMTRFDFRKLQPTNTTRVRDEGIWEVCLIDNTGGDRFAKLSVDKMRRQLLRLTKRRRHRWRFRIVPFVFRDVGTHAQREHALKSFWERWDQLAEDRKGLLKAKHIKWSALDDTTNRLLLYCQCPGFARVARLATIPIGQSLRTAGILVYAVIGRFAPYAGQLGGKTRRERTSIRRLVEHIQRAKFLYDHFVGQRRRNLRTAGKMGHRPSLAQTLASLGGHKASILPFQFATRKNINAHEHDIGAALAPSLNGVTL